MGQPPPTASSANKPTTAVIYPFAVQSSASNLTGPSADACPKTVNPDQKIADTFDPKLMEATDAELQERLMKRMPATIATADTKPQPGQLLLSGCLTTVDAGNAAKRLAGMNLGASHLTAHVVIRRQGENGAELVKEFEVSAKGGSVLPPLGPIGFAAQAAEEGRETLNADAKRLADQILKKLAEKKKPASTDKSATPATAPAAPS